MLTNGTSDVFRGGKGVKRDDVGTEFDDSSPIQPVTKQMRGTVR